MAVFEWALHIFQIQAMIIWKDEKTHNSIPLPKGSGQEKEFYQLRFIIGPIGNLPSFHDLGYRLHPAVG